VPPSPAPAESRAAVVHNPLKGDIKRLRKAVKAAEKASGWPSTIWLETSVEDAGQSATRDALSRGATVVLAAGGDGTVRAVAEALRDTGVPIALIPVGTGNLLARNLGLTLTNIEEAARTAFTGGEHRIDLGIADITREDGEHEEHVFVVVAGVGLDAKMISLTNPRLKKAVGWLAYVDAGVRALPDIKPIRMRYSRDGSAERATSAHTVLVGNCGLLPGGILLMPDAKPDDGILDIAVLRPSGPFGWLKVWNKVTWENGVLRKSALGRSIIDLSRDVRDVTYQRGKDLRLTLDTPQQFQLDGDEFGVAKSVRAWVDPGALDVKVPARPTPAPRETQENHPA
jgi:diacylglycerol kinase (ATP)